MLKILANIQDGKGKEGDIELLEEIAEVTGAAALCALGKTAADPLRSTLRYFREEYEAKIAFAKGPAEKRE
jgi:NADP-reducing hydrogenase subunit HndC